MLIFILDDIKIINSLYAKFYLKKDEFLLEKSSYQSNSCLNFSDSINWPILTFVICSN